MPLAISDQWQLCIIWQGDGAIVAGKRAITAGTDLRLCRNFGLSDGWWLRGQSNYDMAIAREKMEDVLAAIRPCTLLAH